MQGCSDDFILDSNISDCEYGIYIDDDSPGAHTMSSNTIYDNTYGIYLTETDDNIITENEIRDNGHGVWVEHSNNNTIERNMIVNNTMPDTGVHITDYSDENEIHENCFIGNEPQAWDDLMGESNNWDRNYWSPPPGGPDDYTIPGAAGSKDNDPLDECPLGEGPPPARVPALTPLGIIALVGLLSVVLALSIRGKRKK
jgi:parallel beta-helix repeat protein